MIRWRGGRLEQAEIAAARTGSCAVRTGLPPHAAVSVSCGGEDAEHGNRNERGRGHPFCGAKRQGVYNPACIAAAACVQPFWLQLNQPYGAPVGRRISPAHGRLCAEPSRSPALGSKRHP